MLDLKKADVSRATGRMEEASRLGVASFMDVFSPRMALAGFLLGYGVEGTGSSPQTDEGRAVDGDAEEDCKGMEYDTDLAEDVYY